MEYYREIKAFIREQVDNDTEMIVSLVKAQDKWFLPEEAVRVLIQQIKANEATKRTNQTTSEGD